MLSNRLACIKKHIPKGSVVADIGCDHGYLPIDLIESGFKKVYATDISQLSLNKTIRLIDRLGYHDNIVPLIGDGLTPISGLDVDTIVIAGMGGNLIRSILNDNIEICKKAENIIIQPMRYSELIRRWLYENDFFVYAEDYVEDDNRLYQVFCAKRGRDTKPELFMIGKRNLVAEHKLFDRYIDWRISILDKIIAQHDDADTIKLKGKLLLAKGWRQK